MKMLFLRTDSQTKDLVKSFHREDIFCLDSLDQLQSYFKGMGQEKCLLFIDMDLDPALATKANEFFCQVNAVYRFMITGLLQMKDLKQHQRSDSAAHGYIRKPLDLAIINGVLNDLELADYIIDKAAAGGNRDDEPTLTKLSISQTLTQSEDGMEDDEHDVDDGNTSSEDFFSMEGDAERFNNPINHLIQKKFDMVFDDDENEWMGNNPPEEDEELDFGVTATETSKSSNSSKEANKNKKNSKNSKDDKDNKDKAGKDRGEISLGELNLSELEFDGAAGTAQKDAAKKALAASVNAEDEEDSELEMDDDAATLVLDSFDGDEELMFENGGDNTTPNQASSPSSTHSNKVLTLGDDDQNEDEDQIALAQESVTDSEINGLDIPDEDLDLDLDDEPSLPTVVAKGASSPRPQLVADADEDIPDLVGAPDADEDVDADDEIDDGDLADLGLGEDSQNSESSAVHFAGPALSVVPEKTKNNDGPVFNFEPTQVSQRPTEKANNYQAPVAMATSGSDDMGLLNKQEDMLRWQALIKQMREERQGFEQTIDKLKASNKDLGQKNLDLNAELDEVKIELSVIKQRRQSEIDEIKHQYRLVDEKLQLAQARFKHLQQELDNKSEKAHVDVNKIRLREKELENKLELVTMDSEAQIRGRDLKILELKRKIDALEFNMENSSVKEQKSRGEKEKLEEKLGKIMRTLRGSIKLLEDDLEEYQMEKEALLKELGHDPSKHNK